MTKLGVIECFFGPPWGKQSRDSYAEFLSDIGFHFYLYAPKADANLRKNWRSPWSGDYLAELTRMAKVYADKKVDFGVCISPYGTQEEFTPGDRKLMREKIRMLDSLGSKYLGVFFDDMPSSQGMARRQLDVLQSIHADSGAKIVFCPSYYSFDPILDKVFGQRPENYLEEIAGGTPQGVELVWTGPKVISPEIGAEHLREVTKILGRKPFLCDNIFANDGPRNCKFLKIRPFAGGRGEALEESSGWSINPMNQAEISKVLLLASAKAASMPAEAALHEAAEERCGKELASLLRENTPLFFSQGLDLIDDGQKKKLALEFGKFRHPVASEVVDWLEGKYLVGSDCLTD
jgi:hyaluronoglucosaminidase